ncbi:MAG: Mut7-C ubiquitin/RNAse domain-containing protein [Hymenobacteraceae bacterium]|nr:Mut7-C ubiquitin/RNAse domain-containing protein [Hymenobacteraceae bacterium]
MNHIAHFYFHGSLNDFLRSPRKATWFAYTFTGHQTVKDMIEAIGVPHLEVWNVRVNGELITLSHRLQPEDKVEVYPYDRRQEGMLQGIGAIKFILDVHLGTLARSLRMLGFDTLYENHMHDRQIVELAQSEQRIVLTRDVDLLKNKAIPAGYWLRSQHTREQLAEVIKRFHLLPHMQPFTRCMVCNGNIRKVSKDAVLDQLPPKTKLFYQEFYQCENCHRVYWKGSHFEHMQKLVRRIASDQYE